MLFFGFVLFWDFFEFFLVEVGLFVYLRGFFVFVSFFIGLLVRFEEFGFRGLVFCLNVVSFFVVLLLRSSDCIFCCFYVVIVIIFIIEFF